MNSDRKNLMSAEDLAEFIGPPVTKYTVYKWNTLGTGPPFHRVGKHVRYRWADVERWLRKHRVETE